MLDLLLLSHFFVFQVPQLRVFDLFPFCFLRIHSKCNKCNLCCVEFTMKYLDLVVIIADGFPTVSISPLATSVLLEGGEGRLNGSGFRYG